MEIKQRKRLRLKDFDYSESNNVYFVTICTAEKRNYFIDGKVAKIIEDELDLRQRAAKEIRLFCYCLMPDHLHILFSLTEDYVRKYTSDSLSNWICAFKRYTSRSANIMFRVKPLWQKNFYDHVVRKEESLSAIADYILNNPVRKGIVLKQEEYPHGKMIDDLPI